MSGFWTSRPLGPQLSAPQLASERSHEVLKPLRKLKYPLQRFWNQENFNGGRDPDAPGRESIFQHVSLITRTLRSQFWWGYLEFLYVLHGCCDSLSSWAEGCSCHEFTAEEDCVVKMLLRVSDLPPSSDGRCECNMRGRRAPEMATGRVSQFFQDLWGMGFHELLHNLAGAGGVTEQDQADILMDCLALPFRRSRLLFIAFPGLCTMYWAMCQGALGLRSSGAPGPGDLVGDSGPRRPRFPGAARSSGPSRPRGPERSADFKAAEAHVQMILTQKTQVWNCLPWKLCGLAHWHWQVAKDAAVECLRLYDAVPEGEAVHHRLSTKCLSPAGPLRAQVEHMARHGSLNDFGGRATLQIELAKLSLIPIVERVIERTHAETHRRISMRKVSGCSVSSGLRVSEIEIIMRSSEAEYSTLCQRMDTARNLKAACRELCLHRHPSLEQLLNRGNKAGQLLKMVGQILYHMDLCTQFQDISKPRRVHERATKLRARLSQKAMGLQFPPRPQLSIQLLLEDAAQDHFRRSLECGAFLTLPPGLKLYDAKEAFDPKSIFPQQIGGLAPVGGGHLLAIADSGFEDDSNAWMEQAPQDALQVAPRRDLQEVHHEAMGLHGYKGS